MLYTSIFSLLAACNLVFGDLSDCDNQYGTGLGTDNPIDNEAGLIHCAEENDGSCQGPGRVYYGTEDAHYWTYHDLEDGESISCTNNAFGCDPKPGFKKQC